MEVQNLDELILLTCKRIGYVDNFKKVEYKGILISLYSAIEKDFHEQLKLVNLLHNTKMDRKRIKYMLWHLKFSRRRSWSRKAKGVKNDFKANKVDLYNFDVGKIVLNQKPSIAGETESGDTSKAEPCGPSK